jgi:acetyl-CoA C-acetyltransferase
MSGEEMNKRKIAPLAKIVSMGWAGVDPGVMGRGAVSASKIALKHADLKAEDIDYWEINEAFAIVTLNCMEKFNLSPEIVNIKGGAISIGHPLGASGVRLPGTLARILQEKNAKYGLATLCVGGGQGVALIIENTQIS